MGTVVDFFFSPYRTAGQRRMGAALDDGLAHGSDIAPRDPEPDAPVRLRFLANAARPITQVAVYYTTDGSLPEGARGVCSHGTLVWCAAGALTTARDGANQDIAVRVWEATLPGQPEGTLVRYQADGWDGDASEAAGAHWYADHVDPVSAPPTQGRRFAYSVDRFRAPTWFDDAVVYQIFVDRFAAASDERPMRDPGSITGFYGGTLWGVTEKLEYIQSVGANCIWLSPIFESPSHHGYNFSSFQEVAQRFGGVEALRALVEAAHSRGIRILLDFVANHTSDRHPLFIEARRDPASAAAALYSVGDWPPHGYRAYAHVRDMPELMTEHPATEQFLIDAALHWLGDLQVDGLRLDYVPGPSHAFWAAFQRGVKSRYPQALTLGEVTETQEGTSAYAGRMDGAMDFPLAGLLRRVFARREATVGELFVALSERGDAWPQGMARATLLDNHDMHRFMWLAGGDTRRLKLASLVQMTLTGAPFIYYGTEVGLSQYQDAHKENAYARAPMFWAEGFHDRALLEHYRALIALRKRRADLRCGSFAALPCVVEQRSGGDTEQLGAYLRWHGEERSVVALNNTEQRATLRVELGAALARLGLPSVAVAPQVAYATHERYLAEWRADALELELEPASALLLTLV